MRAKLECDVSFSCLVDDLIIFLIPHLSTFSKIFNSYKISLSLTETRKTLKILKKVVHSEESKSWELHREGKPFWEHRRWEYTGSVRSFRIQMKVLREANPQKFNLSYS